MVSGALTKMIQDTRWGDVDVLMVDMPPGTGDAQISISQKLPLTGAVVVSTPQELALADARRGIDMYGKVNTEVVGVVENMAYYCEKDGTRSYVFGRGWSEGDGGGTRSGVFGGGAVRRDDSGEQRRGSADRRARSGWRGGGNLYEHSAANHGEDAEFLEM